jgi:branched chain amino acid efflux pump
MTEGATSQTAAGSTTATSDRHAPGAATPAMSARTARQRLLVDSLGFALSAGAFGIIFGVAARQAGYSLVEAIGMCTIVFAGAAQFAAVGMVASATPWPAIVLLTGLFNARHLLYSAALAPWLERVPRLQKMAMAHLLTDESFALSLTHFRRLGRVDVPGFWMAAMASTFIPWNLLTIAGYLSGQLFDDPARYGLDVVFPSSIAGLAVGLITGKQAIATTAAGIAISVFVAIAVDPRVAVVVGGVMAPIVGLLVRPSRPNDPEAPVGIGGQPEATRTVDPDGTDVVGPSA